MTLVSVVVATNRGGPFLAEALDSVAAQTHAPVEVVLVDDGSPDPHQIARIAAGRPGVRVLRTPPRGVSAARNKGVAATSGELLAFLDDDDRWHPDRLTAQVAALAGRVDAVAGYCGMRTIGATGVELAPADQRPATTHADLVRGPGVILPNLLLRRAAFDAVGGFDEAIALGEDLDLVLRLAERGALVFEPRALVDYRFHGANTTTRHRALAVSLRAILRAHRARATTPEVVAAFDDRLAANDRFAWWSAARAARAALAARRPLGALGEAVWAARFAPLAPVRRMITRERGGGVNAGLTAG